MASAASGAVGGAFGLAALTVELPVSTTIMMRSIADVARSEGADLADRQTQLECVMVLALGGNAPSDDAAEVGYFAVREAMTRAVSAAAAHVARHGLAKEGAPALVRLITLIAEHYSVNVTEKAAAQMVPLIGAVGGAAVNTIFIDHFQSVARGHFAVRRLERKYGEATVREKYRELAAGWAERAVVYSGLVSAACPDEDELAHVRCPGLAAAALPLAAPAGFAARRVALRVQPAPRATTSSRRGPTRWRCIDAAHPIALANWDANWWQRHRVWITLDATNHGDAATQRAAADGRRRARRRQRRAGAVRPAAGDRAARARDAAPGDLHPRRREDAGRAHAGGRARAARGVTFALECSDARFDVGEFAPAVAPLLDEAVKTYFNGLVDPLSDPNAALEIARRCPAARRTPSTSPGRCAA